AQSRRSSSVSSRSPWHTGLDWVSRHVGVPPGPLDPGERKLTERGLRLIADGFPSSRRVYSQRKLRDGPALTRGTKRTIRSRNCPAKMACPDCFCIAWRCCFVSKLCARSKSGLVGILPCRLHGTWRSLSGWRSSRSPGPPSSPVMPICITFLCWRLYAWPWIGPPRRNSPPKCPPDRSNPLPRHRRLRLRRTSCRERWAAARPWRGRDRPPDKHTGTIRRHGAVCPSERFGGVGHRRTLRQGTALLAGAPTLRKPWLNDPTHSGDRPWPESIGGPGPMRAMCGPVAARRPPVCERESPPRCRRAWLRVRTAQRPRRPHVI